MELDLRTLDEGSLTLLRNACEDKELQKIDLLFVDLFLAAAIELKLRSQGKPSEPFSPKFACSTIQGLFRAFVEVFLLLGKFVEARNEALMFVCKNFMDAIGDEIELRSGQRIRRGDTRFTIQ